MYYKTCYLRGSQYNCTTIPPAKQSCDCRCLTIRKIGKKWKICQCINTTHADKWLYSLIPIQHAWNLNCCQVLKWALLIQVLVLCCSTSKQTVGIKDLKYMYPNAKQVYTPKLRTPHYQHSASFIAYDAAYTHPAYTK